MNIAADGLAAKSAGIVLVMLAVAMLLAVVRLVKGPSLPDRVVALDLVITVSVGIMAAYALMVGDVAIMDVGIVVALVAFLGTVAFAGYLERGGRR